METTEEIKKIIKDAKNICIIPQDTYEGESIPNALALFYTLKELHKNVNLIIDDLPEKFNFLVPSLDFISSPKNFVISIPRKVADVSQVYYEKNEDNLKIHLTIDRGNIKKDAISLYFSNAKPDLVITLGIQDFQSQLMGKLDSFGFILDAPILNIDNQPENKKFGKINVVEERSLSEIVMEIITSQESPLEASESLITKNAANCLLAGLVLHYENFKSIKTNHQVFQMLAGLVKKGAILHQVTHNLNKTTKEQVRFLSDIFQNLKIAPYSDVSFAILDSNEFQNFTEHEASAAVEKIKTIGIQNDLLVLWKSHASAPMVKGFFYSKKQELVNKIAESQKNTAKNDWAFIAMPESDITAAKDKILQGLL